MSDNNKNLMGGDRPWEGDKFRAGEAPGSLAAPAGSASTAQELKDAARAVAVTYCAMHCGFQDHTPACDRLKRALRQADMMPNGEL